MFGSKAGAYPGAPLRGRALALNANIRDKL